MNHLRLRFSIRAVAWHLFGSLVVACLVAVVVFGFVYPVPYAQMLSGLWLFFLVVGIDLVCGPLLTFIIFDPVKSRRELAFDLSVVVFLQMAALIYGLHTVWLGRPIYLAYELDRLRVITLADIQPEGISKIPSNISAPGWRKPSLIGVRVAHVGDPDHLAQLQLFLNGQDVAFQPEYWAPYEIFYSQVLAHSHPLFQLSRKHPDSQNAIHAAVSKTGLAPERLRWLPVQSRRGTDWTALIDADTAIVVGWVELDGF